MSSKEVTFQEFGLSPEVMRALEQLGYEKPTPIQQASITPLSEGRDVLGQAQTGTGKTAAFALPLLSRINYNAKNVQILVLAPTRELAMQVSEAFKSFGQYVKDFHVLPIYGGQSMGAQLSQLRRNPQVIVGTPGRVMDHIRRGTLKLENLQSLVLDEADEMLKMGFIEDIEWILEHTPKTRQLALFSATMPSAIRRVANQHLDRPEHVKIEAKTTTVERISQKFIQAPQHHKLEILSRILEVEATDGIIIFARTRQGTTELAEQLESRGYKAAALHGDMNQNTREQTIDSLKSGKVDIVIATDVAARGIDVPRIEHVINYDIPYDAEAYVHRIGRTGRAGRSGSAILFVTHKEIRMLRNIERVTNSRIEPMQVPSPTQVSAKRLEKIGQEIKSTLEQPNLSEMQARLDNLKETLEIDADQLALALLQQIQSKRPLEVKDLPIQNRERRDRDSRDRDSRDRDSRDRNSRDRRPARGMPTQLGEAMPLKDSPSIAMKRYQIDVGRQHQVSVGNIVGAIANEANIESRYIGHIRLYDELTTVDLPEGMPKDILTHLSKVRVCGHRLNIREANAEQTAVSSEAPRRPKRDSRRNDRR
jgi:ATP-dependent RNA helicase DeaD